MSFATNTTAVLAALGLLTAGPVMAQSTADQPSSETAPSGGMQSGQAAEDISDAQLRDYARVWRQAQDDTTNEEFGRALQSGGDLSGQEQSISTALTTSGSSMSVEEFKRVHQEVHRDPSLQARMQEETGVSISGSASGTAAPGQGAPLPSGALGTGPSSVQGGTPPGTKEPSLGTGGPVVPGGNQGGASGGSGGASGGSGGSGSTQ